MESSSVKYLSVSERDIEWGITVNTVGCQIVKPHASYPPINHPSLYNFRPNEGRVLYEYQILYITQGEGFFSSKSCKMRKVTAGTIILLYPGEWHSYYPNPETGWEEHWVGFEGQHIDNRVKNGFFSKEDPLYFVGIKSSIVNLFNDMLMYAKEERMSCQQMMSGIVLHMLGLIYYNRSNKVELSEVVEKIDEARRIMKDNIEKAYTPEEIAQQLKLGYTWFRRMFKKYTGVSPAQYQTQLRLLMAKELLSSTSLKINEIAYKLNFENGSQFATFFKKFESTTPSEYRMSCTQPICYRTGLMQ